VQSGEWLRTRNIQSGAIVTELLKPYDYFSYWLSRDLGRALAHFIIRGIPTFLIGAIAFDILAPASWTRGAAFLLSVVMAVIVSFCLRFMANLAGFWVLDYRGIALQALNAAVVWVHINNIEGVSVGLARYRVSVVASGGTDVGIWVGIPPAPYLGLIYCGGVKPTLALRDDDAVHIWLPSLFIRPFASERENRPF
jgi:hypothetical protein